jgi:hypothetical protein
MPLQEMGPVVIPPGAWRTLESFAGRVAKTNFVFRSPRGVDLKVRYGVGWFGFDRQEKTTDGQNDVTLRVDGWVVRARVQAKASQQINLSWTRIAEGP